MDEIGDIGPIVDAEDLGEIKVKPKHPPKYKRVGRVVACALCHSQRGTLHKLPGEDGYFCDNCFKYLTDGKFPR